METNIEEELSPFAQSVLKICNRDSEFRDWILDILERNLGGAV